MKKTIIALLATAALAAPAFAANDAANQPPQQSQAQPHNGQQQNQNQAQNLSRTQVRKIQTALNKQGFNAGRADGRLGPETRHAVQAFNQKKGIQGNQPTEQTLAQLGINQNQSKPQENGNQQQPNQNSQ
jgi:peptidoglycan hydrolase-like protein with peptidoglycan-binding domain